MRSTVPSARAFSSFMDELTDDDDCWVVVHHRERGEGVQRRHGSQGLLERRGRRRSWGRSGGFAGLTRRDFPKPMIAAVNGPALAGGLEVMLSCDLVVAAEHATFGIPEAKRGLIAAAGGLVRLPMRLPMAMALELAMTGDTIDAARALALGLVNKVVPAESVLTEALALAERIAANAPLSVRYSKSVMKRATGVPEAEAWGINQEAVDVVFSSADAMEGPAPSRRSVHRTGRASSRFLQGGPRCSPPASNRCV